MALPTFIIDDFESDTINSAPTNWQVFGSAIDNDFYVADTGTPQNKALYFNKGASSLFYRFIPAKIKHYQRTYVGGVGATIKITQAGTGDITFAGMPYAISSFAGPIEKFAIVGFLGTTKFQVRVGENDSTVPIVVYTE
ncbi:MAG: hypothetical protein AABY22_36435, partial [Nanoarchaeota archaeon]